MHHQHVWMPWRPTSMWKHWEDKVNGKRPGQFIGRGTIKEFKIYLNSCRYDSQWGRFLVFHFLKLQLVTLFQWSIGKQRWTISLKPAGRNLPQTMGIFRLLRANRWSVLWLPVTNYPVWSSIKERIDWCPVLMLSSTQAQTWVIPRGAVNGEFLVTEQQLLSPFIIHFVFLAVHLFLMQTVALYRYSSSFTCILQRHLHWGT